MKKILRFNIFFILIIAFTVAFYPQHISNEVEKVYANEGLPSEYNLRDYYTIFTEDQSQVGLCWLFTGLKCFETNLAINKHEYYDLSEAWLAINQSKVDSSYLIGDGGTFTQFYNLLTTYGVMLETDLPFSNVYSTSSVNYNDIYAMNKSFANTQIVKNYEKCDFSNYNKVSVYEKNAIINSMKNHIVTNGSIYSCMYATNDQNSYPQKNGEIYSFMETQVTANHAISIIGWDDSFEVNGHIGAWRCLNSWSANWGNDGEFYIPYDDRIISEELHGIREKTNYVSNFDFEVVSSLNSSYKNLKTENDKAIEKNIFNIGDNPNLTYSYSVKSAITNYDIQVQLIDTYEVINDKCSLISVDKITKNIAIKVRDSLEAGEYKVQFNVDIDNNGSVDEVYFSPILISDGLAIQSTVDFGLIGSTQTNIYNTGFDTKATNGVFETYTRGNSIQIQTYISSYSLIKDVEISGLNSDVYLKITENGGSSKTIFNPATLLKYASGYFVLTFDGLNSGKNIFDLRLTSTNGNYKIIKVIIYKVATNAEMGYINYFLDGGTNTKLNTRIVPVVSASTSKVYIDEPTKNGYIFKGWYLDSTHSTPLSYNSILGKYYIDKTSFSTLKGRNYFYNNNGTTVPVYANLYAEWGYSGVDINTINGEVSKNYDTNESSISFSVNSLLISNFTYEWFKQNEVNGSWESVEGQNTTTLPVKMHSDSGKYKCKITFVSGGKIVSLFTNVYSVDIARLIVHVKIDNQSSEIFKDIKEITYTVSDTDVKYSDFGIKIISDVNKNMFGKYQLKAVSTSDNYALVTEGGAYTVYIPTEYFIYLAIAFGALLAIRILMGLFRKR